MFASYLIAAPVAALPMPLIVVDVGVLACTNVVGAMVCYTLEHAKRTNFLEERLLIETASRDGLTGVRTRRMFDEHIARICRRASAPLASRPGANRTHYGSIQLADEALYGAGATAWW